MNRIKELRIQHGFTQQQLADQLGISRTAVVKYETGKNGAALPILLQMSEIFGASVDYIVGSDEQKKEPESMNASELDDRIFTVLRDLPEEKKEDVLNYLEFLRTKSQGN